MKYPIIVILIGSVLYIGSFFLENRANQMIEDISWGKLPQDQLPEANNQLEVAVYVHDAGNYIAIAGEVWLVIVLIGRIKNKE